MLCRFYWPILFSETDYEQEYSRGTYWTLLLCLSLYYGTSLELQVEGQFVFFVNTLTTSWHKIILPQEIIFRIWKTYFYNKTYNRISCCFAWFYEPQLWIWFKQLLGICFLVGLIECTSYFIPIVDFKVWFSFLFFSSFLFRLL